MKMSWDFEYNMRKESIAKRLDVTIGYKKTWLAQVRRMSWKRIRRKDRSISSSPMRLERDNQDTEWK